MMATEGELGELYRETVLDHSRRPRNLRRIEQPARRATGHNPLCGDKITVYLDLTADKIVRDAAFEATGCAISMASASMLTELVRNRPLAEVQSMIRNVFAMFVSETEGLAPGEMAAFAGVRAYPSRVRCATLAWRTLEAALRGGDQAVVSTE
jgi:nitrogen fixation NifU-like protein